MEKMNLFFRNNVVYLLAAMVLSAGCAGTQQVSKQVELKSHFLGPKIYSMLKEGDDDQAGLVYLKPNTKWASYNKLIVKPVTVWKDRGTQDVSPEDLQRLADDLWSKILEEMGKDYQIVHVGGPGTIRFEGAITEAEASDATMDTITSLIPQTRMLTGLKGLAAGGKPGFVGAASIEVMITDAKTGDLLVAAIDRRAGTKNLDGMTDEWGDIEDAYTYWAQMMRWRACELRAGKRGTPNCEKIKPEA